MQTFTPLSGLVGGLLIGLGAALYLLAVGRLAGISGMLESVLRPTRPGALLSATFLLGLMLGGLATAWFVPSALQPVQLSGSNIGVLIAAGLLVGFGTRMANGCTSGHGVCGMPRLSVRSIAATAIFMVVAMVTVFVIRHVIR
jgi:uncharacterized protein